MSVPSDGSVQATFAATLVDEWVRRGLTDAVVCPGSRSTPLVLALAAREEVRLHVRLDERGAGFFAVGLALATGCPPVICTTSGTAAAELHPAVVEAHHARVPVVVCTADRPPELQQVGAPQTIDQRGLFGPAVRWHADPGVADLAGAAAWRPWAARAWSESVDGPSGPGPVHLNLAFREPLVGRPGRLPPGRPGGAPAFVAARAVAGPGAEALDPVASWRGRRGILVAGARCGPPAAVLDLADRLGWPVLADPRSGCRLDRTGVIAAADAILRDPTIRSALAPEVVVLLGSPWASKAVGEHVRESARAGAQVVGVDPWWRVVDPDGVVTVRCRADPGAWLAAALEVVGPGRPPATPWPERWTSAEAAAQRALDAVLSADAAERGGRLTEPALARHLLRSMRPPVTLLAASSMPVRDLEWYGPPSSSPPAVVANRGANGIDGTVSTALGLAAAGDPVVALLGDLAFLHDVSGLVALSHPEPAAPCALVVVDNGGGGIFSLLPQAAQVDPVVFERLFGTPPSVGPAAVATGFGLPVSRVSTAEELDGALGGLLATPGPSVVCAAVPDRADNAALHERLHDAVIAAVRPLVVAGAGTPDP